MIGVSRDSEASHQKFIDAQGLNFDLIVDDDTSLHELYGAWGEKTNMVRRQGAIRSTFVISQEGTIQWRVETFVQQVTLHACLQLNLEEDTPMEDAKEHVLHFLRRVSYADESIQRKMERGESDDVIAQWKVYREFTAYAASEVQRGDQTIGLEQQRKYQSGFIWRFTSTKTIFIGS